MRDKKMYFWNRRMTISWAVKNLFFDENTTGEARVLARKILAKEKAKIRERARFTGVDYPNWLSKYLTTK